MTIDEFFHGYERSRELWETLMLRAGVRDAEELRVSKSQIALMNGRAYAWVWIPGRYLRGETAPIVLSIALGRRDGSPRWKEIVEPVPGRYMHHLEVRDAGDLDDQVVSWLEEARLRAGAPL